MRWGDGRKGWGSAKEAQAGGGGRGGGKAEVSLGSGSLRGRWEGLSSGDWSWKPGRNSDVWKEKPPSNEDSFVSQVFICVAALFALVDVCLQRKHFKGKKVKRNVLVPPPKEGEKPKAPEKTEEGAKPEGKKPKEQPKAKADAKGKADADKGKAKGGKKWGPRGVTAEHASAVWPVFSLEWASFPFQPPSLIRKEISS